MDDSIRTLIIPVTKTKRRYRSVEEKLKIIEEALAPGASVAAMARAHNLNAPAGTRIWIAAAVTDLRRGFTD